MKKHAWVTGANTGIGLETITQLIHRGAYHITASCRTQDKVDRTINNVDKDFGVEISGVAIDLSQPNQVIHVLDHLTAEHTPIELLILNAGSLPGSAVIRDDEGLEMTFVDGLIGHHRLVMGLLQREQIAKRCTIIIAGSESATGSIPLMKPVDLEDLALYHFNGDINRTIESVLRADDRLKLSRGTRYASAKLFTAWWSAALSRRLPHGMRAFTISPGNTYHTSIARYQHPIVQLLHRSLSPFMGRLFRQAASPREAASRYLFAIELPDHETGRFYASPPGLGIGCIEPQLMPHVIHIVHQEQCWHTVCRLTDTTEVFK